MTGLGRSRRLPALALALAALPIGAFALYRFQGRAVHFGVAGGPGVEATAVEIDAGSIRLPGLVFRAGDGTDRPGVVLLHGTNPGGAEPVLYRALAAELARRGAVVLLYDQRGYRNAPDPPRDSAGRYELDYVGDALRAVEFLARRDDVDPGRIRLAGHSFGGAVAVGVAHASGVERMLEAVVVVAPGRGFNTVGADPTTFRRDRLSADMRLDPPLTREAVAALYAGLEVETLAADPPQVGVVLVNDGNEEALRPLEPIYRALGSPAAFHVVPGVGHCFGTRCTAVDRPPWAEAYRREPLRELARVILEARPV